MKCPDCNSKMEREDGAIIKGEVPNASYSCEECGGEWFWMKGVRGLRRVGEGTPDVAAFMDKNRL